MRIGHTAGATRGKSAPLVDAKCHSSVSGLVGGLICPQGLKGAGPESSSGHPTRALQRHPDCSILCVDLPKLFKQAYSSWKNHQPSKMGASLAYYTVLSLAPLIIIAIGVAGLVFGSEAASHGLLVQVQSLAGPEGAKMIQTVLASAQKPSNGILGTAIGIVMLLFGASGVFSELRDSLNKIWDLTTTTGSGLWAQIRERFLTFGMVLVIGFLLLVSLILSAALAALGGLVGAALPSVLLEATNTLVSIVVVTFLFAAIYRFLPAERLPWSDLWIGSSGTAILFVAGKFLLGLYLGRATVGSAYGPAGPLIVLLVWIYYTAQLFFFGAAFTRAYSQAHGSMRKSASHLRTASAGQGDPKPPFQDLAYSRVQAVEYLSVSTSGSALARSDGGQNAQSTIYSVALSVLILGFSWWRARPIRLKR